MAGDQVDNGCGGYYQRFLPAPVAVSMKLNSRCSILFHLSGAWWEMADETVSISSFIGQGLQRDLPTIASRWALLPPAIYRDEQFRDAGKTAVPHLLSTMRANACSTANSACIVVDTDADPALVVEHVVNAIGNCLAHTLSLKIVHAKLPRAFL